MCLHKDMMDALADFRKEPTRVNSFRYRRMHDTWKQHGCPLPVRRD